VDSLHAIPLDFCCNNLICLSLVQSRLEVTSIVGQLAELELESRPKQLQYLDRVMRVLNNRQMIAKSEQDLCELKVTIAKFINQFSIGTKSGEVGFMALLDKS